MPWRDRGDSLIEPAPSVTETSTGDPLISVQGVTKAFAAAGGQQISVLEGIDLDIADGEFVALLGRSGSGKSTLLRCIAGLIAPTRGQIRFRGRLLTGTNTGTAMIFQTFALLPWLTVQQNVEIGLEARHVPLDQRVERALHAIDIVGLDGYESAFPKELSGGMRQRVGFARALVVEPDVLLMDEPFSALDVLTAENLRGELLELWEGRRFPTRSIVLVTHNIEEAVLLADRILVLGSSPGRIRAELVNDIPRPRHRRTLEFDAMVDRLYGIMTGRPAPAEAQDGLAAAAPGTPGDTPLPHATVDGLSGLAEILLGQGGGADLADLARLLALEVDDMLPLVDALVLLHLAGQREDHVELTANGELFAGAGIQESKKIFAAVALEHAPLVRTIDHALQGAPRRGLPRGFFSDILARSFGEDESERQLDLAINWGRYAELFSVDSAHDLLIRELPEDDQVAAGEQPARRRGALQIYLAASPGAGKTFRMLRDGHQRRDEGEDVVVAAVNCRGRLHTEEAIADLELVPDRPHADASRLDVAAVIARHPQVALVDDAAEANPSGGLHASRWQDIEELLQAGIDVMTTLDVGQLEGFEEVAARVTGERPAGTVPDRFIAEAGEIEFVDIAPTALRRRIAHGNVVPPEQAQQALEGPFRIEALGAMRELALRLVATRLGEGRMAPAPEPQDVLVAVAATPRAPSLIRRGTRLARRTGGRCTVLTVTGDRDGDATSRLLERAREVAHHLGATFVERHGGNVTRVIQESVRELVVDHLVIGDSPPPPWLEVWRRPMTRHLIDSLPDVDVHVIARPYPAGSGSSRIQPTAAADAQRERRGSFRIYLGYARGCGTTTAMLDEARRRRSRGTDVAIAAICRPHTRTESAIGDVPLIGENGDASVPTRLDVDRVLTRNPQVACIDDLADALGADGYRLFDLDRMLDAGITLIATLHLSDLRSTAEALDIPPEAGANALDDAVIGMATDIELVDVPVSVLVERVKRGEVVPRESVDAALEGEFSEARLARLREHAFRIAAWKADQQEVALLRADGDGPQWDERPRVMACVAPRPGMERLIRKAAALAASLDTDFRAVTVITSASQPEALLRHYGALVRQLGGEMVTLTGRSAAQVLAGYARENLVTEILVTRGQQNTRAGRTLRELIRSVSEVDIHVLAAEQGVDRP